MKSSLDIKTAVAILHCIEEYNNYPGTPIPDEAFASLNITHANLEAHLKDLIASGLVQPFWGPDFGVTSTSFLWTLLKTSSNLDLE